MRWQIELIFKKLKSITNFDNLSKHDDESAIARLYGKLFVALLTQKLVNCAKVFSPCGYDIQKKIIYSNWREFEFMYHQIQRAIEPKLALKEVWQQWQNISKRLAENKRKRIPHLIKFKVYDR